MTPEAYIRRAIIRAFERIPVVDRPYNERVADAIMKDVRFLEDLGPVTDLYDTVDDLWSCIGKSEIGDLQSRTLDVCRSLHERLYHGEH